MPLPIRFNIKVFVTFFLSISLITSGIFFAPSAFADDMTWTAGTGVSNMNWSGKATVASQTGWRLAWKKTTETTFNNYHDFPLATRSTAVCMSYTGSEENYQISTLVGATVGNSYVNTWTYTGVIYTTVSPKPTCINSFELSTSITLNSNGGSPATSSLPIFGSSVTLPANTFTKATSPNAFYGWNTAANGSGTSYANLATIDFAVTQPPATLFAQWGYAITVTQGSNGTISPGTTNLASGSSQSFTFTPTSPYGVSGVTVDGTALTGSALTTAITSGYAFTNIVANHTITASYALPTLTPSTQTVKAQTGTAITATTAFTPSYFNGTPTYSVTTGTLPVGLSLNTTTGVITGTPTAISSATITITGTSGAQTATSSVTFSFITLTGTTQDLQTSYGIAISDTVTATGGTGTKTLTLTGTSNAGITLDTSTVNTAVLKVASSVSAGTYYETVTATDTVNATATYAITLTVVQGIVLTPTAASITKTYGVTATDTITATLGTGNKTLTLTNLTGESNISISTATLNTAVLSVGAGATTGTYSVSINAVDSLGATSSISISITVSTASAITITAATPSAFTYSPTGISLTNSYSSSGLVASDSVQSITYSYSQFSSCATGGSCQIGDEGPGGGRVFYDAGSTQSWGRYLELSPQGWNGTANDPTAPWCTGVGGNSLVGTQAGIGKGKLNTDLMIAACNTGDAANLANSYRGGGKTDWYLANFQEMEQLVINASRVGYSYTMHTLWVSWEWTANGAQDDVASAFSYKFATIGVRPIRAFDITSNVDTSTTNTLPTNAGTYYIIPSAVTLASSHQSNYAGIDYVNGILTINRAEDTGFLSYATAEAVVGVSYSLYVNGGSGTGAVTYLLTGGTASGCSISASVLTTTSEGTCIVQFTRAQSTNYNTKNSSVIITFRTYAVLTTGSVPSDGSSHGIVISGGGTPWSKNATASPTITSFTPSSGPVGTTITITGTGLNGVTVVRLNFEDMTSVTGVSPTSVTAVVQSGATSGPIYIENSYGADFNFDGFTVTP